MRVGAGDADFEDQPRFAERPATAEIAVVERADPAGRQPIEPADQPDCDVAHSLTLVRELTIGRRARPAPCAEAAEKCLAAPWNHTFTPETALLSAPPRREAELQGAANVASPPFRLGGRSANF